MDSIFRKKLILHEFLFRIVCTIAPTTAAQQPPTTAAQQPPATATNFTFSKYKKMMEPCAYDLEFISIRVVCPKTNVIILDEHRAVDFIRGEPDWVHLDDVVCTFLEAHAIDEYKQLPNPQPHPAGGWITHSFDMGCPRLIWIFPEAARKGGS